jgi:phage shock protein A
MDEIHVINSENMFQAILSMYGTLKRMDQQLSAMASSVRTLDTKVSRLHTVVMKFDAPTDSIDRKEPEQDVEKRMAYLKTGMCLQSATQKFGAISVCS